MNNPHAKTESETPSSASQTPSVALDLPSLQNGAKLNMRKIAAY